MRSEYFVSVPCSVLSVWSTVNGRRDLATAYAVPVLIVLVVLLVELLGRLKKRTSSDKSA